MAPQNSRDSEAVFIITYEVKEKPAQNMEKAAPVLGAAKKSTSSSKKITLSDSKIKLTAGNTKKLILKKGKKTLSKGVKWSSSNKKVATVTSKGVVKAKAAGTVSANGTGTVTYSYRHRTDKDTISGTFTDGLQNGQMTRKDRDGETYRYTVNEGEAVVDDKNIAAKSLSGKTYLYSNGEPVSTLGKELYRKE